MATRKEVAERAGVSVATVSYVVNGTKHVTPEVKARVEEAVKELHYSPNLVAKGLATRKTHHVAMLVNNLRNPYYAEMLAGAQAVASKKGYIVSIIMVDYSNEEEVIKLASRGVDGVIDATYTDVTNELLEEGIPFVASNTSALISYRKGIFEAVEALKEKGHENIAFLSGLKLDTKRNGRYQHLREAFAFYGIPVQEGLMIEGNEREETDEAAGIQAVKNLLKTGLPFTAIVALNDLMAFGAMRELKNQGLRIPEDVSVIGCDNVEMGKYSIPSLSTLNVDSFDVGKLLMKKLIADINHKQEQSHVITASYIERESVGECPRK